jgi:hypothetical protein
MSELRDMQGASNDVLTRLKLLRQKAEEQISPKNSASTIFSDAQK